MARVKAETKKVKDMEMENLVLEYSSKKPKFDLMKKEVEELGDKIKTKMLASGLQTYKGINNFQIKVADVVSESFDNDKLIEWAEKNKKPILKQVTVIDVPALENAVYNGVIAPSELEPFQVKKITKRMTSGFLKEGN